MGYTTTFSGKFTIDKPLTEEQTNFIEDLDSTASGAPSSICQWVYDPNDCSIKWDGQEKFFDYICWMRYIAKQLTTWGYLLNGTVLWSGEIDEDKGAITAADNVITWVGSNINCGGEQNKDESPEEPYDG